MATTVFERPLTEGDRGAFRFRLAGSGDISGATVTASIRLAGQTANLIAAHAVTIEDGPNRQVLLTLLESETPSLSGPADGRQLATHVGDVKVVLGGVTTHYGPFEFPVRTAITA